MTGGTASDGQTAEHERWFGSPARRARQDVDQLLSLGSEVLTDASLWGRLRLLKRLRAALRAMREQGVEGVWRAAYSALAAAAVKNIEKLGSKDALRS